MFPITNGFAYIAFLMLVAGTLLSVEKYTKWKVFNLVPALVWIYALNMVFCTMGLYSSKAVAAVNGPLKYHLLYSMVFVMLMRCDLRKLAKLGPRLIAIFLGCSVTLAVGTILAYPLFVQSLGGTHHTWAAVAALYASWVGSTINMVAMQAALPVDAGAYGCAMALDAVCYIVWLAVLILGARYTDKWNKFTGADTSKPDAVAEIANTEVSKPRKRATASDWILMIGLSMSVSMVAQKVGEIANTALTGMGLAMFDPATCATLFVTVLSLVCAVTPLAKLPAVEELSSVYLYAVVSLLASTAPLNALLDAPIWVVYGFIILLVHVVLMLLLSKLFHWDLPMVATASFANIGGAASAPMVATAYKNSYAGIGILMGLFGVAIGNFFGLGMGAILRLLYV